MIYGLINCYTASGEIFKEVESIVAKEEWRTKWRLREEGERNMFERFLSGRKENVNTSRCN